MDSLFFYIALFIHLSSLIVGMGAVIVIDTMGLLWLLKRLNIQFVSSVANVTQPLIWLGWTGLVLSGIPMLYMKGSVDELTKIKLFFVLMLGINGIFLHSIKKRMEDIASDSVPNTVMYRISLASLISQVGWWGAIIIGFLHRHYRHTISWPESFVPYVLSIAILFAVAYILVRLTDKK